MTISKTINGVQLTATEYRAAKDHPTLPEGALIGWGYTAWIGAGHSYNAVSQPVYATAETALIAAEQHVGHASVSLGESRDAVRLPAVSHVTVAAYESRRRGGRAVVLSGSRVEVMSQLSRMGYRVTFAA